MLNYIKHILFSKIMRKSIFIILIIYTLLPLISFPYISMNYHQIHNIPTILAGELDFSRYDFSIQPQILLYTAETEQAFYIKVINNGPGFDTSILETELANSFGISNSIFRLKRQVNASIQFDSSIGKGTIVMITILKGGAGDAGDYY